MDAVFQDVVQELRDARRSIVLSCHILSEVDALCDRVTIIRAGRAAKSETFDELRQLTRTSVVVDTVRPLESVAKRPGVQDSHVHAGPCYDDFGSNADLIGAYWSSMMQMAGMAVAAYVITLLLRMHHDEAQ